MARPKKEENAETQKKDVSTNDILDSFLKTSKADHYNFEEAFNYKVSTGSMILDYEMDGGLGPGLHRFCGISEGGKTAEAIEVAKNFLNTVQNSRGIYIKAEGRLDDAVIARSGVKFVFTAEEWVDGTMFVLETNIYESAADCILKFINNNPEKKKFIFILDSVDGLSLRADKDKDFSESAKVAGGAVIASVLMKRISIPLAKRGHMAIFISQVRDQVQIDPYAAKPVKLVSVSTGGNALVHFSNWILEFEGRYFGDQILLNPEVKKIDSQTNPIIGHWAKVTLRKSINEKTGMTYRYPIKHGRLGGKSIWIEKEVIDLLLAWKFIEKSGSWFNFSEEVSDLLLQKGFSMGKVQGLNAVNAFLEGNPNATNLLKTFLLDTINGIQATQREDEESEETV